MNIKEIIQTKAKSYFTEIQSWRRHIHSHPELSFEEHNTAQYIEDQLIKMGITKIQRMANTGVVALIGEGSKTFALRADIDALPIQEKNEVSYSSTYANKMHACGHDVHTASLLGAAKILKDLEPTLDGQIKLIFQPAEEKLPGGASILIKEGVLLNPNPRAIIGQHVHPPLEVGKVGFKSGKYMASADEIYLMIIGKGGHAALPNNLVDPLIVVSQLIMSLQTIISRSADPKMPSVLSFGKIYSDGGATNVIPDKIHLEGTFRTFDETWRKQAHQQIKHMVHQVCETYGASYELDIKVGYPNLYNHPEETEKCKNLAIEYLGEDQVVDLPMRTSAEDFAFYSHEIPACFYRLGTGNKAKGIVSPVHTPTFDIDENALELGAGLMAYIAYHRLQN